MASGGQSQTPDNRKFFFRLQILLIDGGLAVLRDILEQSLTSQCITFSACLNREKSTIIYLKKCGVITKVQYDVLFPVGGKVPTKSDLDITLIICLLRNLACFGLNNTFDWRATPAPTDTSIEADIWRLKDFRNKISHILTTTAIQQKDFTIWWNDIERILIRRSSTPVNIKQTIAEFKICPFDPEEERRLQKEIKKWKDYEADVDQLKQEMTNMKENDTAMKRDLEQIKKNVTEVTKDLENVQENDTALHKGLEDIKEKNDVLKRNLEGIKESVTDVTKDLANLKENNDAVKIDLEHIDNNVTAVKRDLDVLKETYTAVKGDLENIKENVSEVKENLEDVKVNDTAVKKDLKDIKENVSAVKNYIDDIKENVNEVKKDIEDIKENVTEVNKNLESIKENVIEVEKDMEEVKENDTAVKREIENIKENVTEVKKDLHVVTENVTEVKKDLDEIKIRQCTEKSNETDSSVPTEERKYQNHKKEVKDGLFKFYKTRHSKIFLSPIFEEKDTPLASFYIRPELSSIVSTSTRNDEKIPVESLSELFKTKNIENREIYVLADAGLGKTAFSKYLANVWCQAHCPDEDLNELLLNDDVDCMQGFDFLFLVLLRDSDDLCSIDELIFEKIVSNLGLEETLSKDILLKILKNEKCLIILDGLDEWTHPDKKCYKSPKSIPHRSDREKCTVLTTTRPWKVSVLDLNSCQLGKKVELTKLSKDSRDTLIRRILQRLYSYQNEDLLDSRIKQFIQTITRRQNDELAFVPLLLIYMICLWCDDVQKVNSKCDLYINIVEFLLLRKNQTQDMLQQLRDLPSSDIQKCFAKYDNCSKYYPLLMQVGKLAYYTLFNETKKSTLVFDESVALKYLTPGEMKFTLHSGMLSENTFTTLTKKFSKVSFSHETVQEFFAAIFISSHSDAQKFVLEKCCNVQDILNMSKIWEFINEMNANLMCAISNALMPVINKDKYTRDFRTKVGREYSMYNTPLCNIQFVFMSRLQERPASENIQLYLQDFFINLEMVHNKQLQDFLKQNMTNIKSLHIDISGAHISDTSSSLREIINLFSLKDLSHVQKLYYQHDVMEEAEINLILFPSLQSITLINGKLTNDEENLIENLARCQNLQYLYIEYFMLSHKILKTIFNFISSQTSMKKLTLDGLNCKEHGHHDCMDLDLDLSKHSTLSVLYLVGLPCLRLNIITPSLVEVKLWKINLGECSFLMSRDMLNIKRVELGCINMSAGRLRNFVSVLKNLPQSVTVEMYDITPCIEYEYFKGHIRRSQTFDVIHDDLRARFEFKTITQSK